MSYAVQFIESRSGERIAGARMTQVPRVGDFVNIADWDPNLGGSGLIEHLACVERVTWEVNDRKTCNSAIVELRFPPV